MCKYNQIVTIFNTIYKDQREKKCFQIREMLFKVPCREKTSPDIQLACSANIIPPTRPLSEYRPESPEIDLSV